MRFVHSSVYMILATVAIPFGAVHIWVWSFYTLLIFAAFVVTLAIGAAGPNARPGKAFYFSLGPFFSAALFLCLPLPEFILARLSPFRFQVLKAAGDLLGQPGTWHTLSYRPLDSLAWLVFLLGLVLFFFVLEAHFRYRHHLKYTVGMLFVLAVVESVYGIVQTLVPDLPVLWAAHITAYLGDARGTWVNRNHFAGFIAMMLPLCLGLTLSQAWSREKISWWGLLTSDRAQRHLFLVLGLVIMALALLFSKSRAGIAATLVGLAVFLAVQRAGIRGLWPVIGSTMGVITLLVVFYGSRIGFGPIIDRFLALDPEASRLDFWRDSLAIIAQHPLGIGPMTLPSVFKVYDVSSQLVDKSVYQLHNDVLQVLVDTGWIGFVSMVGGFSYFMLRSLRRLRRLDLNRHPSRFFMAAGALSGMSALAFHSFFDFNLQIPANCLYFVTLMAIVHHGTGAAAPRPKLTSRTRQASAA
jgi:O-antigen ligase